MYQIQQCNDEMNKSLPMQWEILSHRKMPKEEYHMPFLGLVWHWHNMMKRRLLGNEAKKLAAAPNIGSPYCISPN